MFAILASAVPLAHDEMTPALGALADAERAFAKPATEKGIRDAFPHPQRWSSAIER